jgi:hypothetical protein
MILFRRPGSSRFSVCILAIALATPLVLAAAKPHMVALGAGRKVPYSIITDPAGGKTAERELRVRPLVVDGKVKEWTTGDPHDVTDRSFVVRRALRLNDALPADKTEHWIWQRGPWLIVDRTSGHVIALHLPDYDPAVSEVVWYRDYAAYCGLPTAGKQLQAVVAQVAARKPILLKKLATWDIADHPSPACSAATWQRTPLRVSFQPTAGAAVSYDLVGLSAVLIEDGDSGDVEN